MESNTKNSAHRSPATMHAEIRGAVEALKRQTSTPTPQTFAPGGILAKHKLQPGLLVALVNLNMMRMEGKAGTRTRKFQFTYGIEPISDKVIQNIYDAYKVIEARRKAASTRNAVAKRGEVIPNVTKSNQKPQQKPTNNKSKGVIGSSVQMYSSQLRKSPFEGISGTIFGLKQLSFMKHIALRKASDVLIDRRYTVSGVELITFTIVKSKLVISFYMSGIGKDFSTDETSLLSRLEVDNVVLALHDRTLDSTSTGAIEITTVPVNDPYNLKDY